jgi:uncharacterized protein (DUF2384 family)
MIMRYVTPQPSRPTQVQLLDGENPDIREEARDIAGEQWLHEPNSRLMGRTPEELIGSPQEVLVRDVLRSLKHIGIS